MPTKSNHLKKITAEAKLIRKAKPSMSWTDAVKKASKFYNDTVKPTAKKTVAKAKRVASATKKGYAVARNSYRRSSVGATRKYEVDMPLVEDLFLYMENEPDIIRRYERDFLTNVARKVGSGKLDKSKLPKLFEYLYKNNLSTIKRYYGNVALNPEERRILSEMWTDRAIEDLTYNYDQLYDGRTNSYQPIEKFTKGNIIGKVSVPRRKVTGGSGRIGMSTRKKTATKKTVKQVLKTNKPISKLPKPKKPSLKTLKEVNSKLFDSYYAIPYKEQKIFYSPYLGQYVLIRKRDNKKISYYKDQSKGILNLGTLPTYDVYQINSNLQLKYLDVYNTIQEVNLKLLTDIKD